MIDPLLTRRELLNRFLGENGKICGLAVRQPLDEGRRRREFDIDRYAGARRQQRSELGKSAFHSDRRNDFDPRFLGSRRQRQEAQRRGDDQRASSHLVERGCM